MARYEVFDGAGKHAILIGVVVADDEEEAIDYLYHFQKGSEVSDTDGHGPEGFIEWSHPGIMRVQVENVRNWRAIPIEV